MLGVSQGLVGEALRLRDRNAAPFERVWRGDVANDDSERKLSVSAAHAQLDAQKPGGTDGGKGEDKGNEGESGPHQAVRHMLRDIDKALARKQRTPDETGQLIKQLRSAGPQLADVADALERELPQEAEEEEEADDVLTREQLAQRAGVPLARLDSLLMSGDFRPEPPPDKEGHFRLAHVEQLKKANAHHLAEKEANGTPAGRSAYR
jgi:hypothetical protein